MLSRIDSGWRIAITFAAVALLYLDPVPQSMALNSLDLATSLVDRASIELDEFRGVDVAMRDGRTFSGMPPGAAFVAAMVYGLARPVLSLVPAASALPILYVLCTVLIAVPAAAVTVYLVYRTALRWGASERDAALAATLLAFGTMHLGYATGFYKKTLAETCLMAAFMLCMPDRTARVRPLPAAVAGGLCGMAIGLDYPSALIVAVIAVYVAWYHPGAGSLVGFCAGAALLLAPVLAYHQAAFGSMFQTAYQFRTDAAANRLGVPQPMSALFFIVTLLAASPCLIWSAIGWRNMWERHVRRAELVAVAGIALSALLCYSGWATVYTHEASFASRLLLPLLPFLAAPMAFGIPAELKGWSWGIIVWSVGATLLATQASMIPSGTIPPVYALKALSTSWGTGPFFSVTLPEWLDLMTLHRAIAQSVVASDTLLQESNRGLLVQLMMGQGIVKMISVMMTAAVGYGLWRYVWRPVVTVSCEASSAGQRFNNMRIVLLAAHYQPAAVPCGVGDYTRCLRAAMEQQGHDCAVITSVRSRSQEPHVYPIADRWGLIDCVRVWRLLWELQPDVLVVQYTPEQYGFGLAFKLLPLSVRWTQRRTTVITTFHTLVGGRWMAKPNALLMAAASHGLVSVHAELSALFQRHLPWWSGKLREIPIGANVPAPSLSREAARYALCRRLGLNERDALVGTFGFAAPGKGWDMLFQAMQDLQATTPVHLVCIGAVREEDRPYRAELDRSAQRLGIADRVHWLVDLPAQEVTDCLAGLDVYVVPYDDGASLRRGTLMAGFQANVPTVTTTPRYTHPALRHGQTILAVAPQSPKALAQAVRELLTDVDLQRRLRQGMAAVAEQFQWSAIAQQHVRMRQMAKPQERQAA